VAITAIAWAVDDKGGVAALDQGAPGADLGHLDIPGPALLARPERALDGGRIPGRRGGRLSLGSGPALHGAAAPGRAGPLAGRAPWPRRRAPASVRPPTPAASPSPSASVA